MAVIELSESNFDETITNNEIVIIDFWAPWCGPCKMVAPVVEELAEDYEGKVKFFKLNTDDNPNIACLLYTSPSPRD